MYLRCLDSRVLRRLISNVYRTVAMIKIGRNVHAYVDDIVVKSREKETLIDDLKHYKKRHIRDILGRTKKILS